MLIEYLLFLLLGILAGVAAGLLPGLHINNIGVIVLSASASLSIDPIAFAIFLVAMATSQAFINFIPAIFLGVPDEDTVLSLLPAHKLLVAGRGMEAVRITAKASLYGILLAIALLPPAFLIIPAAYSTARGAIAPILILATAYLIIRERGKLLWATATFFISGYLGWVSLNIPTFSSNQAMLAMFSGLFGIGTLLTGVTSKSKSHPQDLDAQVQMESKGMWRGSMLGASGGLVVGLLPAMSPSQIGIIFQEILSLKERAKGRLEDLHIRRFLVMIASLSAADAMFSIFSLYLIGNPRSGISVIMQDFFGRIDLGFVILVAFVMLITAAMSYKIHIFLGKKFSELADRIDFRLLSLGGLVFVVLLVAWSSGPLGLLISAVGAAISLVPAMTGVSRTHCMGCLMLPTLLFFLGLG